MSNPAERPPSEEVQKPGVIVSISTVEQEVARAMHYASKTQGGVLPHNLSVDHSPAAVEFAVNAEYSQGYYQPGIEAVTNAAERISLAYAQLLKYKEAWGSDLEPNLNVRLTRYGKAGTYNVRTREVIIRVDEAGNTGHGDAARDVIHEAIHFSVEHLISLYDISQKDKEQLVDTISAIMFPEMFSDVAQGISPQNLPAYQEALSRLPDVMRERFDKKTVQPIPNATAVIGPESYPFAYRPEGKLGRGYASIVKELGPDWVVKEFNPNLQDGTPKDEGAYARSQNPRQIRELQETQRILQQSFIYGNRLIPNYWVLGTDETGRPKYFQVQRKYHGRTVKETLEDRNQRFTQFFRENRKLRRQMLDIMWGTKRGLVEMGVFDDFHIGNIAVTTEPGQQPELKLFDVQNLVRKQRILYGPVNKSPDSRKRVLDNIEEHAARLVKYEGQLEVTDEERTELDARFGLQNGAYETTVSHLLEVQKEESDPEKW